MSADAALSLPEVTISEEGDLRHLHLGTPWIQGSMRLSAPHDLALEYVQRMMAWLLFVPLEDGAVDTDMAQFAQMHAMQLGLGAAALTRFHHRRLGMRTTAVEINPQVIRACRQWFRLPADNDTLRVVQADAAKVIARPDWQSTVDALQIDLYDHEAAAPVLDSEDFYVRCRALLSPQGCMTVNLFGRNASYTRSLQRICTAFMGERGLAAGRVWVFRPTREGNTIVLASRSGPWPGPDVLRMRADLIQRRWGLPAQKWLRVLHPA